VSKRRDPVYVARELECLINEARGCEDYLKVPFELACEILPLLKNAKRPKLGAPPTKSENDKYVNRVVVNRARKRFEELRKENKSREEALDEASTYAAGTDFRPEGVALTVAGVRDRLMHPGRYRS